MLPAQTVWAVSLVSMKSDEGSLVHCAANALGIRLINEAGVVVAVVAVLAVVGAAGSGSAWTMAGAR